METWTRTPTLTACVMSLALAAPALGAAVLHTPPMVGGSSGIRCEIKNIGTAAAEVTIEIILTGGTLSVNRLTRTIDPLESAAVVGAGSASVCRFTVAGSRRKFLGSACVLTAGNGCAGVTVAQ